MKNLLLTLVAPILKYKAVEARPPWSAKAITIMSKRGDRKMFPCGWLRGVHYKPATGDQPDGLVCLEWPGYLVNIHANNPALDRIWNLIDNVRPFLVREHQEQNTSSGQGMHVSRIEVKRWRDVAPKSQSTTDLPAHGNN